MKTSGITVGHSTKLGIRGIIAIKNFKENEEIERCPVVLLPKQDWSYLKHTSIWRYYYEWNKDNHALILGHGSLYNHSYEPNARYCFNYKRKEFILKSLKNIKTGEEIFVNYNYFPHSKDPLPQELTDYDPHRKTDSKLQKS